MQESSELRCSIQTPRHGYGVDLSLVFWTPRAQRFSVFASGSEFNTDVEEDTRLC